ncbi:MAG: hypothetical protein J5793_03600, partial [Clostridia bacterium]|nr:hypothetical protein [Clostridia bacterium]
SNDNDVCPDGQMMILPYGKNDDAPFSRNDEMHFAHARMRSSFGAGRSSCAYALIIFRASGMHHLPSVLKNTRHEQSLF